jgi:hypothetical protein
MQIVIRLRPPAGFYLHRPRPEHTGKKATRPPAIGLAVRRRRAIIGPICNTKENLAVATDWQMPRRNDACAGCGRAFEVGQPLQAFLYESRAGYERRDYCLGCQPADQPEPLGIWRTQRPAPPTRKAQPFDREAVYALFQRLEDEEEPEKIRLRFVLALLLWRKKVLKFEGSEAVGGQETWQFSVPRTDETHHVPRPALDEEQVEWLSAQLERALAGRPDAAELAETGVEPSRVPTDAAPENADV